MIAAKLAQRRLVQLQQYLTELVRVGVTSGETLSVNLSQGMDQSVSMFGADFATLLRWRLSRPALLMLLSFAGQFRTRMMSLPNQAANH